MLIDRKKWWQFQQDMTPAHAAHALKAYMEENEIKLMLKPVRSPDLNPIESISAWS